MKIIKTIVISLILIIPFLNNASAAEGRGYYSGGGFGWSVNSGGTCCNSGRTHLLGIYIGNQGRSGSTNCFIPDDINPVITASGFEENVWVNKDTVVVDVKVTDSKSGVGDVSYTVNNIPYVGSDNFNINLTKEGVYNIKITATDKANIRASNGSSIKPNESSFDIIVKIDRNEPIFTKWTKPLIGWYKEKPKIDYKVSDTHEGNGVDTGDGQVILLDTKTKTFSCITNPSNSSFSHPVVNGKVTGTCDPNDVDCSNDSNYTPNSSDCSWTCDIGYVKSGNSCIIKEKTLSCNDSNIIFPNSVYTYNKNQNIIIEGDSLGKVLWSNPSGITINGDFLSVYNETTLNYEPSLNSCSYSCLDGYHTESNKCVNDTSITCCSKPPLGHIADTGVGIDCTIVANQSLVQCAYNILCGGYIKDVLGDWNTTKNKWEYDDSTGNIYGNVSNACGYTNIPNSNGFTCNPRYYLIGSEALSNRECIEVPIGEWSGQSNIKSECTNKPAKNSTYTSNGDNNNCSFTCNTGSEKVGGKCLNYNWEVGSYGSCSKSCGGGTKSRTVECKDSEGKTVNDNKCKTSKPSTNISCNTNSCTVSCGAGSINGLGNAYDYRSSITTAEEACPNTYDNYIFDSGYKECTAFQCTVLIGTTRTYTKGQWYSWYTKKCCP